MAENRDLAALREEIPALREDIEHLAEAGRFLARRRPAARGRRR